MVARSASRAIPIHKKSELQNCPTSKIIVSIVFFLFFFGVFGPASAIDNGSEQSHLISTVISSRSSSTPASYQQRRGDCGDRPYRYRHPSAVFDVRERCTARPDVTRSHAKTLVNLAPEPDIPSYS